MKLPHAAGLIPDITELPQCEAVRDSRYYCDPGPGPYQCRHRARFTIDGKKLCRKHAGVMALNILLSETKQADMEQ